MYFIILTLTLLSGLTVARRVAEPSCPGCAGKRWTDRPSHLECSTCGWSSVAVAPGRVEPIPAQYEIGI
jgi:rubredoxin